MSSAGISIWSINAYNLHQFDQGFRGILIFYIRIWVLAEVMKLVGIYGAE